MSGASFPVAPKTGTTSHLDSLDLVKAASRNAFIKAAAAEL